MTPGANADAGDEAGDGAGDEAGRTGPVVDLRSDTVTTPTDEMREAMARAPVGNSAWGEDPTVNGLEHACAELLGKEAALFVPSGTMGNQIALKVWTAREPFPEVILEATSHIQVYESGGMARISGAQGRPLVGVRGALDPRDVEAHLVGPQDEHLKPRTALVCVEDTHNIAGGTVLPLDNLAALRAVTDPRGLPIHMDGARLFNAATAQGVAPDVIAQHADTVMFCFSKGLAAPIGSVVCGPADFVAEAVRARSLLGGAMRQAGVVAAAAHVALDTMRDRLADDHANARRLAQGLAKCDGIDVDPGAVETNIVVFDVGPLGMTARAFAEAVGSEGVLYDAMDRTRVRAVTHKDVDGAGIQRAVDATAALIERVRAR